MNLSPGIVLAPDKFKGSATAAQVADALSQGLLSTLPSAWIRSVPVADGGEGTVDAAVAAGFTRQTTRVTGPTGEPVEACWAITTNSSTGTVEAVVEMAQASGIELLDSDRLAGVTATSRGTGELLQVALDAGAQRIVLGLGGSASTDGGAGMLAALGVKLQDSTGHEVADGGAALRDLHHVDVIGLDQRWATTELILATDVDNPLLGVSGAAAIFGPQKGLDEHQVGVIDKALAHFASLLSEAAAQQWGPSRGQLVQRMTDNPGAGAAGGTGFAAMSLLQGHRRRGIDVVLEFVDIAAALEGVDLVITGEGSLDEQSLQGKTPVGVASAAQKQHLTVYAVCGRNLLSKSQALGAGIERIFALSGLEPDPEISMRQALRLLETLGAQIGSTFITETTQVKGEVHS